MFVSRRLRLILLLCLAACLTAQAAAAPSAQNFQVDGKAVKTEVYNIDGNNYFKLRDIAMLLKGTQSGFSVDYDAGAKMISISGGSDYMPVGGELDFVDEVTLSRAIEARRPL